MIVCNRNTVRESLHIPFFCGGDPFCEVVRRPKNTYGELTGLLEWPAGLPLSLDRPADLCLQSNITDPLLSFQIPCGSMNILFASRIGWLSELSYFRFFSPVICWSYLRMEISVTLSMGNKLYSSPSSSILFFLWPTSLMLSAKLVYYMSSNSSSSNSNIS